MATLTAGTVMDRVAALLNDVDKTVYTYAVQLPYLQAAFDELQTELEQNGTPMTNETSSNLTVHIGETDIGGSTGPALPSDLIEPQMMYERLLGSGDAFTEMERRQFLPPVGTNSTRTKLLYWSWQQQIINLLPATTDREVKIHYTGATLNSPSSSASTLPLSNCAPFLAYRTAALCASYVGENDSRAMQLNGDAGNALGKILNVTIRGQQFKAIRRRPFMGSYKVRGGW